MRNRLFVLIALIATAFLFSCAGKGDVEAADIIACGIFNPETHICDKRDGNLYRIVKMPDGKLWMAENLKYEHELLSSKCYENNTKYCDKHGRLYFWGDRERLCPGGWKVPMGADWEVLKTEVGETVIDEKLKAKDGWDPYDDNRRGYGTDYYGFNALPSGAYSIKYAGVGEGVNCKDVDEFLEWDGLGKVAVFMSSTAGAERMLTNDPEAKFCLESGKSFVSVRCIKE